jgi:O-antigen ligase
MIRHIVAPLFLFACLILGGASAAGYAANLLLQIAALPLIGWALWSLVQTGVPGAIRAPLALLGLLVLLALLQLVPMPPSLWTMLPGRGTVVSDYHLLGVPLPWLPLSLAPDHSLAGLLWLLPAFAILLCMIVLGAYRGRNIAIAIIAVTLLGIGLGALQIARREWSYFYEITNHGMAVGFFANGNHNATLLLIAIPFLAALQKALLRRRRRLTRNVSAIRLLVMGIYTVILVGLLINKSLAGLGLSVPVTLVTWMVFGEQRRWLRRSALALTVAGTIAALVAIAVGPFNNNLFGHQTANADISRQTSFTRTWEASRHYLPFGTGIGSFQPVYRMQEPLATITPTYMNHAHNDWLELLLETGVAGIGLAVLFLVWWVVRVRAIWTSDDPDPFAQAAVIASAAIMLHSIVDYPLRTAAVSAIFAACVGLMSGVRPYVRPRRTLPDHSSARHISI